MGGNGLLAMLSRAGSAYSTPPAARPAVALSSEVVADSRADLEKLLRRLGSSLDGLAAGEAQRRLLQLGPNQVAHERPQTMLREFINRA